MTRKPALIVISNLYPNALEPTRGMFIHQLVERLAEDWQIRVVSPLPWRPALLQKLLGQPRLPASAAAGDIPVHYPRHVVIPKTARASYAALMVPGLLACVRRLHKQQPADLIAAHWLYPDGVAAVAVARRLSLPVVVHGLGCDLNEFSYYRGRREQIAWALQHADATVVKAQVLKDRAMALGAPPERVSLLPNGVDRERFQPRDQQVCRQRLGLPSARRLLLFIGNFQVEKGLDVLLEAFASIAAEHADTDLVVVGSGPLEAAHRAQTADLQLQERVHYVGRAAHEQVVDYLNAADFLCLPSLREGCPNVVLEALACGTPVVASRVGAVPDMLSESGFGRMAPPGDSVALAAALREALAAPSSMGDFSWPSWADNALAVSSVYHSVLNKFSLNSGKDE